MPYRSKGMKYPGPPGWGLGERLTISHRKKYKCLETWNQSSETSTVCKTTNGKEYEEADGCKELEESSAGERGKKGLDKGGQGPISDRCAIEEEDKYGL
jgi:hypothetical protein